MEGPLSDQVNCTFGIPPEVTTKLAAGIYERYGGVIRDRASGHLITFLRERFADGGNNVSGFTAGPAIGALTGIDPVLAMQVLNLGISVGGFALVLARLKKIDAKLDRLIESMDRLELKVGELRTDQIMYFISELRAALEDVDVVSSERSIEKFNAAEKRLASAMNTMLQGKTLYSGAEFFSYISAARCLALLAKVQIRWKVKGPSDAKQQFGVGSAELISDWDWFIKPFAPAIVGDERDVVSRSVPPMPVEKLIEISKVVRSFSDKRMSFRGYSSELDFCSSESISLDDWDNIHKFPENKTSSILCIFPKREF